MLFPNWKNHRNRFPSPVFIIRKGLGNAHHSSKSIAKGTQEAFFRGGNSNHPFSTALHPTVISTSLAEIPSAKIFKSAPAIPLSLTAIITSKFRIT